jgi:hypothetical protein
VGIAEILERLGRERAPHAARAVDDDVRVLVGEPLLGLHLEEAPRHVHGPRDEALAHLVLLSHVDDDVRLARLDAPLDLVERDGADLGLHLREEVRVSLRHGAPGTA